MAKILIIEDELSIVKMLKYDLEQLNYQVDSAQDGLLGYQKAMSNDYDLILLDLMLPSMSGLEICKKLRQANKKVYIIMLTAMDEEYQKIDGFDVGSDDYITKPFSPRELTARIKAVLRRQLKEQDDKQLIYDDIKLDLSSYEATYLGQGIELTLKEFELLQFLIVNRGKALSREQLLNTLWGYSYDGDTRVVDVHIFKLREKIAPLQDNIKAIRGIGYKLI